MCAQFIHSALGDKGGGVQLVCEGTYGLAWGVIFDERKDRGVVCVSLFSKAGGSVCGHVCVNTHTHTHAAQTGYSGGCEPRGRDEIPGGPEESRWTKSRHICIRICVQGRHCTSHGWRGTT